MLSVNKLIDAQCRRGDTPTLSAPQIDNFLAQLPGWAQQDQLIYKTYRFDNYYQSIAFVNAVAWLSHRTDHHPELTVSYNNCRTAYSTQVIGDISTNDFICAANGHGMLPPLIMKHSLDTLTRRARGKRTLCKFHVKVDALFTP